MIKVKLYEIVKFNGTFYALDYLMEEIAKGTNSLTVEMYVRELGYTERMNDSAVYKE